MAPRKKPGMILKRDHAFTEAIGKPGNREPNAFSMASEDAKAKLEAAQARGAARSVQVRTNTAADRSLAGVIPQSDTPCNTDRRDAPETGQNENPPAAYQMLEAVPLQAGGTITGPARVGTDTPPKAARVESEERIELIVSITVSEDLLERAARWGAVAHQPATTVLRHALKKMKPLLLEELQRVQAGDVHQQRIKNVGYRLQSRLRFSPVEFTDLEARLDPAGFGILSSMLNH